MAILDQKYHHWKELSYRVAQPRGWAGGDLSQGSRLDLFLLYFLFSILPSTLSHSVSAPVTLAPPAAPSFCSLLLLSSSSRSHCLLCSLQASPSPARSGQVLQGLVRPRWAFLGLDRSVHAIMVLLPAGQPAACPMPPSLSAKLDLWRVHKTFKNCLGSLYYITLLIPAKTP